MAANRSPSGQPTMRVARSPEGMHGGPVATLLMTDLPTCPPLRRPRRPPASPDQLALRGTEVAFSLGGGSYALPAAPLAAAAPDVTALDRSPARPVPPAPAPARVPEIKLVSPLPAGAESITIEPHPGSAVLAIAVRDATQLHLVPLRCASIIAGGWQLRPDSLGRNCWHSGEARLRLPPVQGAATVELTLVAIVATQPAPT